MRIPAAAGWRGGRPRRANAGRAGPGLGADAGAVAEPKWDGYRAMVARLDDGRPFIRSRSGTSMTAGFPEISAAVVEQLPPGSLLDGELVI